MVCVAGSRGLSHAPAMVAWGRCILQRGPRPPAHLALSRSCEIQRVNAPPLHGKSGTSYACRQLHRCLPRQFFLGALQRCNYRRLLSGRPIEKPGLRCCLEATRSRRVESRSMETPTFAESPIRKRAELKSHRHASAWPCTARLLHLNPQ